MKYNIILLLWISVSVTLNAQLSDQQKENPQARNEWMRSTYENAEVETPDNFKKLQDDFSNSLPNAAEGFFAKGTKTVSSQTWMPAGPNNIGGRTRAVVYDRKNSDIIISGGVSGGIWRSVDGGQSWVQTTGIEEIAAVSSIIQDPRPGKSNNWYCAGGESTGNSASMVFSAFYGGNGIFKSTDNGVSWKPYGNTGNNAPQINETIDYVYRLAMDPTNLDEDILYVAGVLNILKISDNGNTIENALNLPSFVPLNLATDILITPSGKFYATLSFKAFIGETSHNGIFYSEDGLNWTNISPDILQPTSRIVMDYSESNENIIYFLSDNIVEYSTSCDDRYPDCYSLFKLDNTNAKLEWTDLSSNIPFFESKNSHNYLMVHAGYCMDIEVSPIDTNIIFLAGANCYISYNGFTSTDRTQWIAGYSPEFDPNKYDFTTEKINYYKNSLNLTFENGGGWDFHFFAFNPNNPNEVIAASDAGLHKLSDISEYEDKKWESLNNGYRTTQFYDCAINRHEAGNNVIFGGLQDNNTLACFDANSVFSEYLGGDGLTCFITNYGSAVVSSQYGVIARLDLDNEEVVDFDYISYGSSSVPGESFHTIFALNPKNEKELAFATSHAIAICDDITHDSAEANLRVTNIDYLGATAIEYATAEDKVLYIGTSNRNIYRVTDFSEDNLEYNIIEFPAYVTGYYISDLWIDPQDNNHFIAIVSNYLTLGMLETKDGGETWTDNGGNLEDKPDGTGAGHSFRCYERMVYEGDTLHLLGTSDGLFSTKKLDGANTIWMREGSNTIGKAVIEDIEVRELDGRIVIATHGNGLFKTNFTTSVDDFNGANLGFVVSEVYPNPASEQINFVLNSDSNAFVEAKLLDMQGKEVANILSEEFTGTKRVSYNASNLTAGTYFLHISDGTHFVTKKVNIVR